MNDNDSSRNQPTILSNTVAAYLHAPPVEWHALVMRHKANEPGKDWFPTVENRKPLAECVRELDSLIQEATRLRTYLDQRHGSGCGDQGHVDAVKASNASVVKVRRALGFSYPERGQVQF